jgi:phosphoribosylanthranilate isomerase
MPDQRPVLPFGCVQVAGVRDQEEAEMLVRSGVHLLGFPFGLPVHAEDTPVDDAAAIIRTLSDRVLTILITYLTDFREILPLVAQLGVQGVQLHGRIGVESVRHLRAMRSDLLLLKSLIVGNTNREELFGAQDEYAPHVDGFLTDTLDPETGAEGATGRVHDWGVSQVLARRSARPLLLAGGLTPDNVAQAIEVVAPFGVDAHTGLEGKDGRKDPEKVRRFVRNAAAAFSRTAAEQAVP